MHHAFLYISLPSLDGVNCQISRFIDNGNIRRQTPLSLSKLEFTLGKCAYIGQSERVGIITLKFQRTRSQFFSAVFAAVPVLPIGHFHSRGQHLCKSNGTKEIVCIRKESNSHRIVWNTNLAAILCFGKPIWPL